MLGALYLVGVPLFGFLAWVFSDAAHAGGTDDRTFRRLLSAVTGALWPLILVGVAQLGVVWLLANLSRARRPASAGLYPSGQSITRWGGSDR